MGSSGTTPDRAAVRRWRRHLADEHLEAAVYRELAARRTGEEAEVLRGLAEAESRHIAHWERLLAAAGAPVRRGRASAGSVLLAAAARRFGSVFVLAMAQRAEGRSPYEGDVDATPAMAADERVHAEIVRGLAARGRARVSGTFRAAVFGANDGLVSNLALVLGVSAGGVGTAGVLLTGLAGLLAGALSMGAGEYVSVRSQHELLEAGTPTDAASEVAGALDVDANELALVYRARGMGAREAQERAAAHFPARAGTAAGPARPADLVTGSVVPGSAVPGPLAPGHGAPVDAAAVDAAAAVGGAWTAAGSSAAFFAAGAIVPVLPLLVGLTGTVALVLACVAVGAALLVTGAVVGLLSGGPPLRRALRQLAVGGGAAAITWALGTLFDASLG